MSRRPLLRSILFAVAFGLLTNVLVTAWCVYNASTRNNTVYFGSWIAGSANLEVSLMSAPGKHIACWSTPDPSEPQPPLAPGLQPPSWASTGDPAMLARLRADPPKRDPGGYLMRSSRFDVAYGWPLPSFRGGFYVFPSHQPQTQHDFAPRLPEIWKMETNFQTCEPRTMPLIPMAIGTTVNSALYAAAWWPVFGIPVIRRLRRAKRGLCPKCHYDLRGLPAGTPCPECGRNAPPPSKTAETPLPTMGR